MAFRGFMRSHHHPHSARTDVEKATQCDAAALQERITVTGRHGVRWYGDGVRRLPRQTIPERRGG